jgi:hypothetical protein
MFDPDKRQCQEPYMDKSTLMALIVASILVIVNAGTIAEKYPANGHQPDGPIPREDRAGEPRDVS